MMYPKKNIETIFVKNFSGSLDVSDEIFDVLKILDQDLILWKKNEAEVVMFSKESWGIFFKEMQKRKGFNNTQLFYTRAGSDFVREICAFSQLISLREKKIYLNGKTPLKNFLKGKDFYVSFCF